MNNNCLSGSKELQTLIFTPKVAYPLRENW